MGFSFDNNTYHEPYLQQKTIKNYPKSLPISALPIIESQSKKCICKIFLKSGGTGTGFFCKIPFPTSYNLLPVLITTNHNLDKTNIIPGEKINFLMNNSKKSILIDESRKTYSYNGKNGDITIIEIKKKDDLDIESFIDIDNTKNDYKPDDYKENNIYIIHYPNGIDVEYSVGIIKYAFEEKEEILHTCDTQFGSSGGPIINKDNYKAFGVHQGYMSNKNLNIATLLKTHIKNFYNKVKEGEKVKSDVKEEKEEKQEKEEKEQKKEEKKKKKKEKKKEDFYIILPENEKSDAKRCRICGEIYQVLVYTKRQGDAKDVCSWFIHGQSGIKMPKKGIETCVFNGFMYQWRKWIWDENGFSFSDDKDFYPSVFNCFSHYDDRALDEIDKGNCIMNQCNGKLDFIKLKKKVFSTNQ